MFRKFRTILQMIARELIEENLSMDEAVSKFRAYDFNITELNNDLRELERLNITNDEEIDALKALLSYLMVKNTDMDIDDIYITIFGNEERITWH